MNEQNPDQPFDRREFRRQRREARRVALSRSNSSFAWVVGIALVLLGVVTLLQNMNIFTIPLQNWGALFILIPALGAFYRAWWAYRDTGNQITRSVWGAVLVGLVLTFVTAVTLFNANWTFFGPALIILTGVGILVATLFPAS